MSRWQHISFIAFLFTYLMHFRPDFLFMSLHCNQMSRLSTLGRSQALWVQIIKIYSMQFDFSSNHLHDFFLAACISVRRFLIFVYTQLLIILLTIRNQPLYVSLCSTRPSFDIFNLVRVCRCHLTRWQSCGPFQQRWQCRWYAEGWWRRRLVWQWKISRNS